VPKCYPGCKGMGGSNGKETSVSSRTTLPFDTGSRRDENFLEDGKHPGLSLNSGRISTGAFGPSALFAQGLLLIGFWPTDYDFSSQTVFAATIEYGFLSSIMTLLLVGMGFMYAYLKAYGLSAIGFSFLQVALGVQWALLVHGWMRQTTLGLTFCMADLVQASASVLACSISFGVLVGKISPLQTLVLTFLEVGCFFANKDLLLEGLLGVHDNSTISVCVFAAYFGLAASVVYGPAHDAVASVGVTGGYHSELLSFLGALFAWLNWPSFVGGSLSMGSAEQRMAILNCIFALLGSTVVSFAVTTVPTKRLFTSVALASLAGGVAIGGVANFEVRPGGALLIGGIAGGLACWCFKSPFGNTTPFDTFNIHAVFGLPGLFGGFASVVAPLVVPGCYLSWSNQLAALLGTWFMAVVTGGSTGYFLKLMWPPAVAYTDETYWDTPDDLPRVEKTIFSAY